jgi:hypothetical protein
MYILLLVVVIVVVEVLVAIRNKLSKAEFKCNRYLLIDVLEVVELLLVVDVLEAELKFTEIFIDLSYTIYKSGKLFPTS